MILPVGHNQIQYGCQIDPHGTLFRHFNIYNFLLDNICFQKKLVPLNIPGGAREAPYLTRLPNLYNTKHSHHINTTHHNLEYGTSIPTKVHKKRISYTT